MLQCEVPGYALSELYESYSIFDEHLKLILSAEIKTNESPIKINVSDLPSGLYFLRLRNLNGENTAGKKFAVMR
jgi:hypothetical protein